MRSIVQIFDYIHELNIVYRDLKPENIMLDMTGSFPSLQNPISFFQVRSYVRSWIFGPTKPLREESLIFGQRQQMDYLLMSCYASVSLHLHIWLSSLATFLAQVSQAHRFRLIEAAHFRPALHGHLNPSRMLQSCVLVSYDFSKTKF